MRVKTLRAHDNDYPPTYTKAPGRKYELPDDEGKVLIDRGLVEKDDGNQAGEADRVQGTGSGAGGASKGDGKERPAKGGKGGA